MGHLGRKETKQGAYCSTIYTVIATPTSTGSTPETTHLTSKNEGERDIGNHSNGNWVFVYIQHCILSQENISRAQGFNFSL